jgi:hypothetical protein
MHICRALVLPAPSSAKKAKSFPPRGSQPVVTSPATRWQRRPGAGCNLLRLNPAEEVGVGVCRVECYGIWRCLSSRHHTSQHSSSAGRASASVYTRRPTARDSVWEMLEGLTDDMMDAAYMNLIPGDRYPLIILAFFLLLFCRTGVRTQDLMRVTEEL